MKDNNVYKPLKVQEKVLEIVEECFKKENDGDLDARKDALEKLGEFLIKTGDGSYTLESEGLNGDSETMHTHHGGLEESLEKYVKPSNLIGKNDVHILDICSGLGYTTAVCLEYLLDETKNSVRDPKICIEMVEISPLTLATGLIIPSPLKSHEIVKKAIEDKLYSTGFLNFRLINQEIPENITLNVHISDAREIVKNQSLMMESDKKIVEKDEKKGFEEFEENNSHRGYDAIILAPFSPAVSPELYSLELLKCLRGLLKKEGMFLTYTSAAAVRYSLVTVGFHVGEGPSYGRRGGTIGSVLLGNIEKQLSCEDERMVALTDAGIPFRDPSLNDSREQIADRRKQERTYARKNYKFASTVKSPIYLFNDIKESRLRRRVLKDMKKLDFEDPCSKKSKYIVCPQFPECICDNSCKMLESSSERIIEMEKRLNETVKQNNQ